MVRIDINMSLDIIVDVDPDYMDLADVKKTLKKIEKFEKKVKDKAGVILKQNRQFGGSYRIASEKEASELMKRPVIGNKPIEIIAYFYPHSYFEELKEKLEKESKSKQYN